MKTTLASTDSFWAYVAGFADGEGTIKTADDGIGSVVRVALSNTHKGVLDLIKKKLGFGSVHFCKPRPGTNRKDCYVWVTTDCEAAVLFIKNVLPYLVVKRGDAEKALKAVSAYYARRASYRQTVAAIYNDLQAGEKVAKIVKKHRVGQQMVYNIRKVGPTYGEKCDGGNGRWFKRKLQHGASL